MLALIIAATAVAGLTAGLFVLSNRSAMGGAMTRVRPRDLPTGRVITCKTPAAR